MLTTIYPGIAHGTIPIIGSKSVTHRALICAALSDGESIISNVTMNDDIYRTLEALKVLGAKIIADGNTIKVKGIDKGLRHKHLTINAHESGSTLRFLIPIATALSDSVTFVGSKTLLARPLEVYEQLFKAQGLDYQHHADALVISGSLKPGQFEVAGNISSQFISGLLMMMPLLTSESNIKLSTGLESKPYVDLTVDMMKKYGVDVHEDFSVLPSQTYKSCDVSIEGDYSQAAFFAVLGAINNTVTISNLNKHSKQGDRYIFEILELLGTHLDYSEHAITVYKSKIKSGTIDLQHTPDLGPILFILGLFSEESLRLKNIERLKIKESNRLEAMKTELQKFGAHIEEEGNDVIIHRLNNYQKVSELDSHNDHRIVMALSILASTLDYPVSIKNSEAIRKSYPEFFNHLNTLNIKTLEENQ